MATISSPSGPLTSTQKRRNADSRGLSFEGPSSLSELRRRPQQLQLRLLLPKARKPRKRRQLGELV